MGRIEKITLISILILWLGMNSFIFGYFVGEGSKRGFGGCPKALKEVNVVVKIMYPSLMSGCGIGILVNILSMEKMNGSIRF